MKCAVTGAFGYSGRYIAQRLLDQGDEVITLTGSPQRENPFSGRIPAFPFNFNDPDALATSLRGVEVLINTYWVRFNHRDFTLAAAISNTRVLFAAARKAGVERVVHLSITNPSRDSPLEYFRGKAELEEALFDSGLDYAILRPALLFGHEGILINNIAWALRYLPVFGVFGDGCYRVRPIHVDDLARLAVEQATARSNAIIDAVGPEIFIYRQLVETIGETIGKRRPIVSVSPALGLLAARAIGWFKDDVLLTKEEIQGLMAELLWVPSPPTGSIRLTEWLHRHADDLGRSYASELVRRRDRKKAYKCP